MECAGGEGKPLGLLAECFHEFGVAMSLVDCGVGRETVNVVLSFGIPNAGSLCASKDDGKRMVVVGCVFVLGLDCAGGRCGVVPGFCQGCRRGLERLGTRFESTSIGINVSVCVRCHDDGFCNVYCSSIESL